MTFWRIYINCILVDLAMFPDSTEEAEVIKSLVIFGFAPEITIKKSK